MNQSRCTLKELAAHRPPRIIAGTASSDHTPIFPLSFYCLRQRAVSKPYLVKIGLMGMIGRYDAPDYRQYERDAEVICRTPRGLEVGRVLCDLNAPHEARETEQQGQLLRSTTSADTLILERLQRHRDRAFQACQNLLKEQKHFTI